MLACTIFLDNMPFAMKPDDEIRLKILSSLLSKGAVKPNIKQIKRETGFHKSTILSSLAFLEKEGILSGYGPKIDFRKFGYSLEIITLIQADLFNKPVLEEFLSEAKKDPSLYWLSEIFGSGTYNVLMRQVHEDVESYNKHMQQCYYSKIKDIYNLVLTKQVFFTTEPIFKNVSRTRSIIGLIKKDRGLE